MAQIHDLARCASCLPAKSVILYGPVGAGKNHVAPALGLHAIHRRAHHRRFRSPAAKATDGTTHP